MKPVVPITSVTPFTAAIFAFYMVAAATVKSIMTSGFFSSMNYTSSAGVTTGTPNTPPIFDVNTADEGEIRGSCTIRARMLPILPLMPQMKTLVIVGQDFFEFLDHFRTQ